MRPAPSRVGRYVVRRGLARAALAVAGVTLHPAGLARASLALSCPR